MAWPKSFQPESGEYEGCAHVRQHVSGCLPEKSGGHQIARNERFSHGHTVFHVSFTGIIFSEFNEFPENR